MALGQFVLYRSLLRRVEPERELFLAVPTGVFEQTFQEPIARPAIEDVGLACFAFDPEREVITEWMTSAGTGR